MVTRLVRAWCATAVVATVCFLTGWTFGAEPAVAPYPAALVGDAAAPPHRGFDSERRAQSEWVLCHDGYRSQPKPTDLRMPVDGVSAHFRPLLEIHLGAYELPIFLYVPNPQTNWPRE
jgi:hypothetical protein